MAANMPTEPDGPSAPRPPADTAHAAEILLLLRLVLNEGGLDPAAVAVLRRVARGTFGIGAHGFELLLPDIEAYGHHDPARASAVFRERPCRERRELGDALLSIARRDKVLRPLEARLRGRIAAILGLDEADLI